jgi:hypothetical protein
MNDHNASTLGKNSCMYMTDYFVFRPPCEKWFQRRSTLGDDLLPDEIAVRWLDCSPGIETLRISVTGVWHPTPSREPGVSTRVSLGDGETIKRNNIDMSAHRFSVAPMMDGVEKIK